MEIMGNNRQDIAGLQEAILPDYCSEPAGNFQHFCYFARMGKALELALAKAAALPEAAQEQLGLEMLERIRDLEELRADLEAAERELDAGLGEKIDPEELLRTIQAEHAAKR